jgi:hypothetical protein
MAPRQIKMPDQIKLPEKIKSPEKAAEAEPDVRISQRKRPEVGRYLLQVDRQTKGSYLTAETAHSAGLAIKKGYPLLHVTVYDSVECAGTTIALPAAS